METEATRKGGKRPPRYVLDDPPHRRLPRKYSRGRWPLAAGTAAGTVGVIAAAAIGVPEVMLGLAVGYATYEILRHRMGLLKALQAAAKLERDLFPRF